MEQTEMFPKDSHEGVQKSPTEPSFDCIMKVKGSKGMEEGPVEDFFRNRTTFYSAVSTHVGQCDKCCPQTMLHRWQRLRHKRNKGSSSAGLISMALKTERQALKKGRPVRKETVDWFIMRAYDVAQLVKYEARFSDEELEVGFRDTFEHWKREYWAKNAGRSWSAVDAVSWRTKNITTPRSRSIYWVGIMLANLYDLGIHQFPSGSLMDLAIVAEVMCR